MSNPTYKIYLFAFVPMLLIGGYLLFKVNTLAGSTEVSATLGTAVSNSEGKQIIELKAKAGYSPASVVADSNKDTILRVVTDSTFDCSSALTIPKLGIRKNLPPTAVTDIPLGVQPSGTKLAGTCAMGMYNFNISFN